MMDITSIANNLLQSALPGINHLVSGYVSQNMDPVGHVTSGSFGLPAITLPLIGTVEADVHYSVTNLMGLRALTINNIAVTGVDGHIESFTANISLDAKVGDGVSWRLDANASAHIKAGVWPVFVTADPTGSVFAEGISASGTGAMSVKVDVSTGEATLESITIDSLDLRCDGLGGHLDGVGVFSPLTDALIDAIAKALEGAIIGSVGDSLESVVKTQINSMLPYTAKVM